MNKKLLFLVTEDWYFLSHRLPLALACKENGYEVYVACKDTGRIDEIKSYGFNCFNLKLYRGYSSIFMIIKNILEIRKVTKHTNASIIHAVSVQSIVLALFATYLNSKVKFIAAVTGLGSLFLAKTRKEKIIRFLLIIFLIVGLRKKHLKVIVQNKDDKNTLISWGVLNPLNVRLIKGSGVKLENFVDFSENNTIPVVCFASRFLVDKGIYDFVSAAKLLHKRGVQAQFILAGDLDVKSPSGINSNDLEKLKKNKYIKILEYQKNIPTLYARSHIICLPSYREGLPKALIEAAAANRAVVTTDVPGCRDAIIPGKTGLLVPLKDPQKLADALQWLIENPQRRREMGNAGRQLAESQFGIEKIVKDHLNIYYKLLDNK